MRRTKETIKAGIALVIFFASVTAMDSEYNVIVGIVAIASIIYFGICGRRVYGTN